MARASILSDELLRQLMAVGQVDILVGVPTLNNAATIGDIVRTLHVGLAKHFPRERTVIVNPDGGSDDGTRELVREAPMADEELRGSTALRTTHRVSATYPGLPGRASGVRTVFAAADLLHARTVVLFDADLTSMTPDWVAELATPVWKDGVDLMLPIHPRRRFDGPLLSQLVRPLIEAAYSRRLRANVGGDFGCSGRFATRLVPHLMWERDPSQPALDIWLVATALAEDFRLEQVHLGPLVLAPRPERPGLRELFEQVVGATFACLDHYAPAWLGRTEVRETPTHGQPRPVTDDASPLDPLPMAERFRAGVRDLAPLLKEILAPGTLAGLQVAANSDAETPRIPDALWVATAYEFAASAHRGVMNREHLTQAMIPLYLGRTASYFAEIDSVDEAAQSERLAALELEYERLRPHLLERWNAEGGR